MEWMVFRICWAEKISFSLSLADKVQDLKELVTIGKCGATRLKE